MDAKGLKLLRLYDIEDKSFKRICDQNKNEDWKNHGSGVTMEYKTARNKLLESYPELKA